MPGGLCDELLAAVAAAAVLAAAHDGWPASAVPAAARDAPSSEPAAVLRGVPAAVSAVPCDVPSAVPGAARDVPDIGVVVFLAAAVSSEF